MSKKKVKNNMRIKLIIVSPKIQRFIDSFGMGVGMTRMITISFRDNITNKKKLPVIGIFYLLLF
jgi:hypothetical protein